MDNDTEILNRIANSAKGNLVRDGYLDHVILIFAKGGMIPLQMDTENDEAKGRSYAIAAHVIKEADADFYIVIMDAWMRKVDAEQVKDVVEKHFGCTRVEGPKGPVFLTAKAKIGKTIKEVK